MIRFLSKPFFSIVIPVLALILTSLSHNALASSVARIHSTSYPSHEACAAVGKINVQCYNRNTQKYLGMISVDAGYWFKGGSQVLCIFLWGSRSQV